MVIITPLSLIAHLRSSVSHSSTLRSNSRWSSQLKKGKLKYGHFQHIQLKIFRENDNFFALIIGVNDYPHAPKLLGAAADAEAVHEYLCDNLGVPKENITILLDTEATKRRIIDELRGLQGNAKIKYGDPIMVYFAGHGTEAHPPSEWQSQGSNGSNKIQFILPYDYFSEKVLVVEESRNGSSSQPESKTHEVLRNVIPDRAFGALLSDIAHEKGDNIVRYCSYQDLLRLIPLIPSDCNIGLLSFRRWNPIAWQQCTYSWTRRI